DGLAREGTGEGLLNVGVDPPRHAGENEHEPERHDDDGEDGRVLHGTDHRALDEEPAHEGDDEGGEEGDPVGQSRLQQRPAEVRAEHGHGALGEVHHVRRLVDHHEGESEARVDAARGEPRHYLLDQDVHYVLGGSGAAPPPGPPITLLDGAAARTPPPGPPTTLLDGAAARTPPPGPPITLLDGAAARTPPPGHVSITFRFITLRAPPRL